MWPISTSTDDDELKDIINSEFRENTTQCLV